MSIDLGSPAIDVAIGLAFVFFLLSTVISAVTEGIAWVTKQRAKQLEKGLKGLLGDNQIADTVLGHSLVRSDVRTEVKSWRKKRPSYVSARNFSLALVDTLAKRGNTSQDPLEEVENGATDLGENGDALEEQLAALFGDPAVEDLSQFRKSVEGWFDDAMDRVSGWYKRWAQLVTCGVAVIVAVGLNVSAVKVAETLANEETIRTAVAAQAQSVSGAKDAKTAGEGAQEAVKTLELLKLPVLWNDATDDVDASLIVGWLITAIAISLGAPFWFDALGKLARLRTAGKRPTPTDRT